MNMYKQDKFPKKVKIATSLYVALLLSAFQKGCKEHSLNINI